MNKPWDNESSSEADRSWMYSPSFDADTKVVSHEKFANLERRLRHAEEQIELLLEGLDFCEEDTGGLTNKQWDKRIRSARAHLEAARQEDGR